MGDAMGFGTGFGQGWMDGRLVAWSVAPVKVVINWVSGNPSVAIDSGPLGQESANIWGVKCGAEVLDPQPDLTA